MRDIGSYHSALFRIRSGQAPRDTVWTEQVRARSDSAEADRRRQSELLRPLGAAVRRPYRAVLLKYSDAVTDLVIVAPCAVGLGAVARASLDPDEPEPSWAPGPAIPATPEPPRPEWGLGAADAPPAIGRHTETADCLPGTAGAAGTVDDARLTAIADAAMRLVVARYEGRPAPATTVGDFLAEAGGTPGTAIGPPRVLTEPADAAAGDLLRYVPCFDPARALTIYLARGPAALRAECAYRQDFFAPAVAERLTRLFLQTVGALAAADPGTQLGDREWIGPAERQSIAELGGAGIGGPAAAGCVHHVVEAQAARHPEHPAVSHDGVALSYGELSRRADGIAVAIRELGAGPGSLVGVCLGRSADLVVALLAVLKAGAAYLPLDPAYPAERLGFTLRDAAPALVIGSAGELPDTGTIPRYELAQLEERAAAGAAPAPAREACPDDPAYVIYTSGSSGRPKGVVVPHRNVVSLIAATADDFGLTSDDTWTLFHSVAFDFAVWEIWGCLMTGGQLTVVPYWTARDPEQFHWLLAGQRVTVLSQTPSAFSQLMRADADSREPLALRLVVFGGETLDARILRPWFDRHPERGCRLVNMFGITETTVHVTAQTVTRAHAIMGTRSVGRVLPGWYVYIADSQGRMLPPGAAGEIYVGGAGVATGYLNRPALTAERFTAEPRGGERVYRSGDRGRLLPDGRLEHLGRLDSQVQLRGFRIELDEIRAVLLGDPCAAEAAVVVSHAETSLARIDAYMVLTAGADPAASIAALRSRAAQFLPDYMLPSTITPVGRFPLTSNGKLDILALEHAVTDPPAAKRADPAGRAEPAELMRAIWADIFGRRVGPDDDFFELGGNSLLAVRLAAAARDRGLPAVGLRDLYRNPTVSRLVASHESASTSPRGGVRRGRFLDRGRHGGTDA